MAFLFFLLISYTVLISKSFLDKNSGLFYTLTFFHILALVCLSGLFLTLFFFPQLLYGLPEDPPEEVDLMKVTKNGESECEKDRHKLHLEEAYLQLIDQKVSRYMNEFQPYLRSDFTLNHLSVQINIPLHHLSYYFKNTKKKHFNDYRNEWRIIHAKKLIKEGKNEDYTLEAIGFQSGFSSRNTFLVVFKRFVGVSPSELTEKSKK
jgi:AraC-like DNA-binding protein